MSVDDDLGFAAELLGGARAHLKAARQERPDLAGIGFIEAEVEKSYKDLCRLITAKREREL